MKKLFMMAMLCAVSSAAFAGDSPELKAILKAKTYDEAATLLKAAQLATPEENAKAYNKLVDLALDKANKETGTIAENTAAQQLGTGKVQPYDTLGLGDAICNAIEAAVECDKYDQQPNAKGKVSPKFANKNAERIWAIRNNLVNIGQEEAAKGNNAGTLKYWGAFIDSDLNPLFDKQDKTQQQAFIGQVAYWAGRFAYDAGEYERANRYLEVAMKDPEQRKEALNFKVLSGGNNLQSKADTLAYINDLKDLYAKEPSSDVILDKLYNLYDGLKDKEAQTALLDAHLANYPNSFAALANKGMMAIADNNAAEGAEWLRKAAAASPENPVIFTYLGTCLNAQASGIDSPDERKAKFFEAVEAFDKAKELDPNKQQANWGYVRYQAYYNLYGEDDPRTQAAEADSK